MDTETDMDSRKMIGKHKEDTVKTKADVAVMLLQTKEH